MRELQLVLCYMCFSVSTGKGSWMLIELSVFKELLATSSTGADQHLQNLTDFPSRQLSHIGWLEMCFAGVLRKADAWKRVPFFSICLLLWWWKRYQEKGEQIKKKGCRYSMFSEISPAFQFFEILSSVLNVFRNFVGLLSHVGKAIWICRSSNSSIRFVTLFSPDYRGNLLCQSHKVGVVRCFNTKKSTEIENAIN